MNCDGERPTRVVLVDDHPMWLDYLQRRLGRTPGFEVVGVAMDGATALHVIAERHPTILLLDIVLPDCSGESVAEQVRTRWPDVAIVVLTGYPVAQLPQSLWAMGVARVLPKLVDWPECLAALQAVVRERRIIQGLPPHGSQPEPSPALTRREQAVLELLAAGHSNADIARSLTIAERTVEFHITHVLGKLAVRSRMQAVRRAEQQGLLHVKPDGRGPG
jgi:DNA-binding NarL/FixJ family response regulator